MNRSRNRSRRIESDRIRKGTGFYYLHEIIADNKIPRRIESGDSSDSIIVNDFILLWIESRIRKSAPKGGIESWDSIPHRA